MLSAVRRVLGSLGKVHVENLRPVEMDIDLVAVDDHFLVVPLADGPQIAASAGARPYALPCAW